MRLLKNVIAVTLMPDKFTDGGLHIPDDAGSKTLPVKAIVELVGSKVTEDIYPGSIVFVPFHLGNRMKIGGKEMVIYDMEDVLAKI